LRALAVGFGGKRVAPAGSFGVPQKRFDGLAAAGGFDRFSRRLSAQGRTFLCFFPLTQRDFRPVFTARFPTASSGKNNRVRPGTIRRSLSRPME